MANCWQRGYVRSNAIYSLGAHGQNSELNKVLYELSWRFMVASYLRWQSSLWCWIHEKVGLPGCVRICICQSRSIRSETKRRPSLHRKSKTERRLKHKQRCTNNGNALEPMMLKGHSSENFFCSVFSQNFWQICRLSSPNLSFLQPSVPRIWWFRFPFRKFFFLCKFFQGCQLQTKLKKVTACL